MNILKDLLNNAALLLSLWVIYALLPNKKAMDNQFIRKLLLGLFIGLIGVAIMMNPLTFAPGIRFDARSILLSISGLFFGFIPTLIAAIITIIYRLYLGGAGAFTGVIIILTSAAVGLCWRYLRKKAITNPKWLELYLFGIIIHILMLITLLTLPNQYAVEAIQQISFSLLLIYPIATVLLGKLLSQQIKQQELALELTNREEQYRLIVETAEEGICLLDVNDKFVFVNQKFADMIGYSISEIKTKTLEEFISEEFKQLYKTNQEKRLEGICEQYEMCLVNKQGQLIWTLVSASTVTDIDGAYAGSLGMYTDITQRKENENRLHYLGQIFDDSLNEIYIYDYDSMIFLEANRAAQKNLGYTLQELQQLTPIEIELEISRDNYSTLLADLKNGIEREKVLQASQIRKDGSVYIAEHHIQLAHIGTKPVFIAYVIDITERIKSSEEARKSEKKFRLLYEQSPYGILICQLLRDQAGKAIDFIHLEGNQATTEQTGFELENFIGKKASELIDSKTLEDLTRKYVNAIETGQPYQYIEYFSIYDRTLHVTAFAMMDDQFIINFFDITDLVRAETDLRKNEALLNATQKTSKVGGWEWDIQQETMYWTDETYRLHDLEPNDIDPGVKEHISRSIECYREEDRPAVMEAFQRCAEEGIPYDMVFPFTTYKKRQIWIRTSANAIWEDGQVVKVIGILIDVTERKNIEDNLEKSQERFKLAFETSPDAININRVEDGMYVVINEGFTNITGYTREDVFGKTSLEINIWKNPEDRQKLVKGLREHGYVSNMEAEFQLKNGDVVTALMSARIIMLDDVPHILSITREIEDYKRTQLALLDSERKYRTLFEELVTGFALHEMIFDENDLPVDYRFLEVNPAFERLTGLKADDILGKTVLEVLPETEQYWIDSFGEVVKTKQSISFENYSKALRKYYEVTAYSQSDNQFASIFLDVTDRMVAEQELQRSRKQLRALTSYLQTAIEEERKYIAREIHDVFGQLMTALKMDLSWLNRHSGEQTALQQRFESMNELVDQAIVTARRISSELRPGLLDDLGLIPALEWYSGEFSNRADIECILNLPELIPELDAKLETALYRIFQEVLTNVARHADATAVKIDLITNQELTLIIHDNGRGITPQELQNQQSLGLLGMRERASRWGGTIEITGEPDEGTKVIITIPLSPQQEERDSL